MQTIFRPILTISLVASLVALLGGPAVGHHGWSWSDPDLVQLEGTIRQVSMSPPHPTIHVTDAEGTVWRVELGNPGRTARSGFGADTAQPGDPVTVLGNRDRDRSNAHMKAVRIVIGGQSYDMYPERIPAR